MNINLPTKFTLVEDRVAFQRVDGCYLVLAVGPRVETCAEGQRVLVDWGRLDKLAGSSEVLLGHARDVIGILG